ncbi:hypothetical protein FOL47_000384 [Perkinsus chesapeaki]|uniref:Uncharacterized protein n=1 Tax=Perkinsus chesapeaki TaxID=330153 RepID=A0A7J6MLS4_PERCH|nr:hypothetical protein FOL47_000384 [Perkinsus chesapeaki]
MSELRKLDHFGVLALKRDEVPSDVAKAIRQLNEKYFKEPPPELKRLEEYLHHEAHLRQQLLPNIRAEMKHHFEEAMRVPKAVLPAIHQGFQTSMALNAVLDGEKSTIGHTDIKGIARDIMNDTGKAL